LIVRDSRSPRGRLENGPPSQDFNRLMAMAVGPILPEGTTCKDLNDRVDQDALRKARAQEPRTFKVAARHAMKCSNCKADFMGASNSKYCKGACKTAAYKKRQRTAG
jgi:hypothetical protein